jgi:hypothetical protein
VEIKIQVSKINLRDAKLYLFSQMNVFSPETLHVVREHNVKATFRRKNKEEPEAGEKCAMTSFIICTLQRG